MNILALIFRTLTKLVFFIVAVLAALGLLVIGLLFLLFVLLKALITGRKPAFVTTYTMFRQASRQFKAGRWQHTSQQHDAGDIIEGEATVIRHDSALTHQPDNDKS